MRFRVEVSATTRPDMTKSTVASIRRSAQKARGWSKGLAPYVLRTISLQRPLANRRIRQSIARRAIDEYFAINVNGHDQWLRIRSEKAENPIILYLHGGPGGSQIPSYRHYQLGWERSFTIVHWEQRGAGKSYSSKLDLQSMTLPQLIADALTVIDYLSARFDRQDIILLGHSWGTLLGIHVLQEEPAAVSSYIGVGQVSNQIESEKRMYRFVLNKARAEKDSLTKQQLSRLHGYPLQNSAPANVALVRQLARHAGYLGSNSDDVARTYNRLMETPEYGLADIYRFLKGTLVSSATLARTMLTNPDSQPTALSLRFGIPVFFISGRRDHFTPADLADDYLESLEAPDKRHIIFEESGHYPNEDEPERFIQIVEDLTAPYLHR